MVGLRVLRGLGKWHERARGWGTDLAGGRGGKLMGWSPSRTWSHVRRGLGTSKAMVSIPSAVGSVGAYPCVGVCGDAAHWSG